MSELDNKTKLMNQILSELNQKLSFLEYADQAYSKLYSETKKVITECQSTTKEIEKGFTLNIAKIKEAEEKKTKAKEKTRDNSTTKSTIDSKSQANIRNKTPAKALTNNKSNFDTQSTVSKNKTPAKNLPGVNKLANNHNKSLSKLNTTTTSIKGNTSQRAVNLKASGTTNNLTSNINRNLITF